MMSNSMRGLTNFISDIRSCPNKEVEKKRVDKELSHIRERFLKEASMKGYDRKKYVCKMLYIYMLGYTFDFGHMEAVNLLSSLKYSEKQIGYLACALLLQEDDEVSRLIINSIMKDIVSRNELWMTLALSIVANIGGREMAETLHGPIEKILTTSGSPMVRKRAALALLRLYRKFPDIISPEEWKDKVIDIVQDRENMGIVTATLSLLIGLISQGGTAGYEALVPRLVKVLHKIVISKEFPQEYVYYGVPNPWYQVKCLRLLQFFPTPTDATLRTSIREIITKILNTTEMTKNANKNNASYSVLFEAINWIISSNDADRDLLVQAAQLLGRFISAREPNIRYLGLETMSRLATVLEDTGEQMRKHQTTIFNALRDTDISIRKQALNMLYMMCDKTNAQDVVAELLDYLQNGADFNIREDLVLRIALLAEKYASDLSWYVDVALVLIQQAGDFVAQDVWWRVIQIVTNNADLQPYAVNTVLKALSPQVVSETLIKVSGYIIGEFGGSSRAVSASEQFETIHARFALATPSTRQLLLTAYAKMAHRDQSVRERIQEVFKLHTDHIEAELQQRACEYLTLSQRAPASVAAKVMEKMPPFPERESSLAKIIRQRQTPATEKVNRPEEDDEEEPSSAPELPSMSGHSQPQSHQQSSHVDNLLGDDLLTGGTTAPKAPSTVDDVLALLGGGSAKSGAADNQQFYEKLCITPEGLLYDDAVIQVALKSEYHGHMGRMALQYINKSNQPLTGFRSFIPMSVTCKIEMGPLAGSQLNPGQPSPQMVAIEALQAFRDAPSLNLQFTGPQGPKTLNLKLPIVPVKFIEPLRIMGPEFFKRWNAIMTPSPQEVQHTFKYPREINPTSVAEMAQRLAGFKMAILDKLDPNPANLVAAGLFISAAGQIHVLVRVECAPQQNLVRLTVRMTSDAIVAAVADMFKFHLSY